MAQLRASVSALSLHWKRPLPRPTLAGQPAYDLYGCGLGPVETSRKVGPKAGHDGTACSVLSHNLSQVNFSSARCEA